MTKYIPLLFVLFLCACSGVDLGGGVIETQSPLATPEITYPAVITWQPSGTPWPTQTETPTMTPDPLLDLKIANEQAALDLALAIGTATVDALNREAQQTQAAGELSNTATAVSFGGTALAYRVMADGATSAAIVAAAKSTDEAAAITLLNGEALKREQIRTRLEPAWQGIQILSLVLIVVAVLIFGGGLALAKYRQIQEERAAARGFSLDNVIPPSDYRAPGKMRGFVSGINLEIFGQICDREQLEKIGRLVLAGGAFSHPNIVRTHGILTETYFTALQDLFCEFEMAAWVDDRQHSAGCKLTEKGLRFFAALTKSPPPPQSYAPITPSAPSQDTIDDGFISIPGRG
jgi:hypothetical protein